MHEQSINHISLDTNACLNFMQGIHCAGRLSANTSSRSHQVRWCEDAILVHAANYWHSVPALYRVLIRRREVPFTIACMNQHTICMQCVWTCMPITGRIFYWLWLHVEMFNHCFYTMFKNRLPLTLLLFPQFFSCTLYLRVCQSN